MVLRVVGCFNPETEKYHCYVTTLPPESFSVEEITSLYSLRWVVELLFKFLKSSCRLDHVNTGDPDALRTLIYASLLAGTVLSAVVVASALATGTPPHEISLLTVGIAAPMLAIPLLLLWLPQKIDRESLATAILRTVAVGCRDQNPRRTCGKWGALS